MTEDTKSTVRREFGANAGAYVTSATHAKGASLERLLALTMPQPEWHDLFAEHGFAIEHAETLYKRINFATWAARHDANLQRYLLALLRESSDETADFLQPYLDEDPVTFRLWEGIIVGRQAIATA
ncbi:MAG: hypothetical protein R6W76_11960 [Caldilinea sp.]